MHKLVFKCLLFLIAILIPLNAEICFDLGTSMRYDRLDWSIAASDNDPNILSELKWRNLKIFQIEGQISYSFCSDYFIRLDGDYGWIYDGNVTDADYHGDNRTDIFSLSKSRADKGHVWDASLGLGYTLDFSTETLTFTPLIGISANAQYLTMINGELILNTIGFPLGEISGLHSTYDTFWYGPWIGLDTCWKPCKAYKLWSTLEYHFARYEGTGHWNLRSDIEDFHQIANGNGFLVKAGLLYNITDNWVAGLRGSYQIWTTKDGRDSVPVIGFDGELFDEPLIVHTKLNPVHWQSWTYSASISYTF